MSKVKVTKCKNIFHLKATEWPYRREFALYRVPASSLWQAVIGGLLVERRTSVSQIRGSIPGQVAAV